MEVGISVDGVKVMSHLLHQIWKHIQGRNIASIYKTSMGGMMQRGIVLTGKVSSPDTCLSGLWKD
jgi:hypothetical protein